jgi:hypothetical protein
LYFNFFPRFLLHNISVCRCCHIYQCAYFLFFVFNYYICPICCNLFVCAHCFIHLLLLL